MPASAKHSGIIKPIIGTSVRHAGIIKPVIGGWVKNAGIWKPALRYPVTVGPIGSYATTGDGSSYSGSVSIGEAPAAGQTRHLLFMATVPMIQGGPRTRSCTLGGIAATYLTSLSKDDAPSRAHVVAYIAEIPTGTTMTWACTPDWDSRGFGMVTIPLYNLGSATPVAIATASNSGAATALNLTDGGRFIAACVQCYNGSTFTVTGDMTSYREVDTNSDEWANYARNDTPTSGAKSVTFTNASSPGAAVGLALAFD